MLEFSWPWLWCLAPLPILIRYFVKPKTYSDVALKVPFYNQLAQLNPSALNNPSKTWLTTVLLSAIWLLCLAAAARPQWVGEPQPLTASGRDLLLAVDISESMKAEDMQIQGRALPRIDVIKLVVSDFAKRRAQDRIGLILFGSQAYLQAPLTFDREAVGTLLEEAQLGFAGPRTAIGDALGLAVKRLKERPAQSRVVILLTDGANTDGAVNPRQAADLAKLAGVKIYTIGVGAEEMIEDGFFGPRRINPSADLDEDTLKYIADTTGGQYFRARNPDELVSIYTELDQLEPIEQDQQAFRPTQALFYGCLAAAFLLSLLLFASKLGVFSLFALKLPFKYD